MHRSQHSQLAPIRLITAFVLCLGLVLPAAAEMNKNSTKYSLFSIQERFAKFITSSGRTKIGKVKLVVPVFSKKEEGGQSAATTSSMVTLELCPPDKGDVSVELKKLKGNFKNCKGEPATGTIIAGVQGNLTKQADGGYTFSFPLNGKTISVPINDAAKLPDSLTLSAPGTAQNIFLAIPKLNASEWVSSPNVSIESIAKGVETSVKRGNFQHLPGKYIQFDPNGLQLGRI